MGATLPQGVLCSFLWVFLSLLLYVYVGVGRYGVSRACLEAS